MSENKYSSLNDELKEKIAEAKLTGKPVFTAYQKKIIDNIPAVVIFDDIDMGIGKTKTADVILSLNRPSRFRVFINSVKSFFKRLFGIKDDSYTIQILKNRASRAEAEYTVNFKTNQIVKTNKNK